MLSNKKWFQNYARIRTAVIIGLVLLSLCQLSPSLIAAYEPFWNIAFSVLLSLLLTILLFDYLQKPSFLELAKQEDEIELKLYRPDARYFFFTNPKVVKSQIISSGEVLTYRIYKKIIPALNQIEFFIKKKDGNVIKTDKINIGCMSKEQMEELGSIVKSQA
jgi:hypothetical protein